MSRLTERLTFTVPLSFEAHSLAQKLSKRLGNQKKAKQVYLNTLAVYAVNFYLQCMAFETNWELSDSRNPVMLKFLDVADLEIKQIGKLECRPVLPDAEVCHIPPDAWSDRIGYVAVQLNQSLKQATLLGFTQTAASEIPLSKLQPLEDLIDFLSRKTVNLRQWFEGIIESGWLALEDLLSQEPVNLEWGYKNAVGLSRGKQIDLGLQLQEQPLALVVTIPPEPDEEVNITVQVRPMQGQTYLPQGVKLIVMNDSGEVVLDTESREVDNIIQLQFIAELGEQFSISVALGEVSVTQEFSL
ncbi:MAG TPA: hypothetical protein DDW76_19170 [Cyanobacteria bacterium UBA11369]|nr:hypothetical protein [Cyanobacteria bacterium UBA11371]HBE21697.1 hypothetical protein [Cyanobacteria bacterium UBA11367]HBE31962.1 hypothetical protein [Cyanobacteria bacterium UBA11368]HBE50833.1 hypothetical protein [Cyanobacteria bacterium UBA11369]